ncbi:hypothetical protein [Marinobacter sp. F4216]|uniref:hypothetical protein n=1 Tax=Marinobacter sp. F4216 TaxID=2874281 RepID=UPI001CBBE8B7|nr:hypothetical protein [Marinobacter sp. F4216]MBZ2170266.1 hypothetical protein [Marinobacter sp. F4216]
MFYTALDQFQGDVEAWAINIGVVALSWILFWCVLEAYALEGIVPLFAGHFLKTGHLFDSLGLEWIGAPFWWVHDQVKELSFFGSGDFANWFERGFYAWLFTGMPELMYRLSRG